MSYDRARVDSLRLALGASLEELYAIRGADAAAAEVMRSLGAARQVIEDWLPRVHDILNSTAMTSCTRSPLGTPDVSQAAKYAAMYHQGRVVITDPFAPLGPPAPHDDDRTMEEVFAAIESGELQPMNAPMDANGRANAPYESLTFAPSSAPTEIGRMDVTSLPAKFVAFWSIGLPVGWEHTETLTVTRMENVRVTKSVHRLTAFDRDEGPPTIDGLTTTSTVSGFMITMQVVEKGEVTHEMQEGGDPTAHIGFAQQESTSFSVAFYPDEEPVFAAVPAGARYENPDVLTVTTSASPMKDDWGTWHA